MVGTGGLGGGGEGQKSFRGVHILFMGWELDCQGGGEAQSDIQTVQLITFCKQYRILMKNNG